MTSHTSGRTYGRIISAEMPGWLKTLTTLPTSCTRAAKTISGSAPARSARVAVWRACTSWSHAKPSVMPSSWRSMLRNCSATRGWFFVVSAPMTAHSSAVDSSIRVKVALMGAIVARDRPETTRVRPGSDVDDLRVARHPVVLTHDRRAVESSDVEDAAALRRGGHEVAVPVGHHRHRRLLPGGALDAHSPLGQRDGHAVVPQLVVADEAVVLARAGRRARVHRHAGSALADDLVPPDLPTLAGAQADPRRAVVADLVVDDPHAAAGEVDRHAVTRVGDDHVAVDEKAVLVAGDGIDALDPVGLDLV